MSRKTHVNINDPDVETRFANWIKMTIDLVAPKNMFAVLGRGTGKTSDIIAERSMDIIYDMPRSYQVFAADTYVNAHKNIVPSLLEGWVRKGWREGRDFVLEKPPPISWAKPYKPVEYFKHTISIRNGVFFNLVSMDQPTGAAGNSYQHIYVDEAKNVIFNKLKKLMPALRGYIDFAHSVYYRGFTATTDMPNVAEGEHDWILDREKDMDIEQIKLALHAALIMNNIKEQLYNAIKDRNKTKVKHLKKQLERWTARWVRARKDSTFFYVVSSFVNIDVLTSGYFTDSLKALGIEEFKTAIISLRANIKKGEKFYVNLGAHHFYDDGILSNFYDNIPIGDAIEESSLALKYVQHNKEIDCGVDFGDMCSMVTGQEAGKYVYLLKNFYTLAPSSSKELANQFTSFYRHHKTKVLNMYYDRSGNQYSKIRRDWATELKDFIEFKNGSSTGWTVNLMNRNQATIMQEEEYSLMKTMLGEYSQDLPKIKIDKYGCRELKSSMELAKLKIKTRANGSKTLHKDKSSEKLPLLKLPMFSTNMSDAGKYFFFRPKWVNVMRKSSQVVTSDPGVY